MYKVANNAETKLAQAISATSTELIVEDGSKFPDPPFVITIDDEIIEVNARIGNTFSGLKRGQEGTFSQEHKAGSIVENRWTAGTYEKLADNIRKKWEWNEGEVKGVKVDNAANADTVGGFTVGTNVPADAKFTDTIYTHPSTHPASMITGLSEVATSGSYNDLTDKPTALPADGGTADNVPWTGVTGKPTAFPPAPHNHDTLYEPKNTNIQSHISSKSNPHGVTASQIGAETPAGAQAKVDAHSNNKNNPHSVTKSQVGLGSVQNYGVATQAEAQAGTSNSKYMTPLRTKEAIQSLTPSPTWESISGKPATATRWPSWDEVTNKPSERIRKITFGTADPDPAKMEEGELYFQYE